MPRRGPINLRLNDFEEVADYISYTLHDRGNRCAAVVAPDGQLRLLWPTSDRELTNLSQQHNFIGIFSKESRVEIIEDDVLAWLRSKHNHLRH